MQSEQTQEESKPLPVWLSIPIILLCLGCGGWIIRWYVMTDPISHETTILADAPAQPTYQPRNFGGGQGNNRPRPALQRRGIQFDQNTGVMDLRTEKIRASVVVSKGTASLRNIFYINVSFLPQDAYKKILQVRNLIPDQKRTEAMKLDVHQVNQLRSLQGNPPMAISADDKTALLAAAQGYVADQQNRAALEPKILQQLDEIGDRSTDATKQAALDRAAQIDAIVTPAMWAQDAAMGGAGGAPAPAAGK